MPTIQKTYYEQLNLTSTAADSEIRKAYIQMALKYHPDKQVGKDEAERKAAAEQFLLIQRAYETLNDPLKRRQYDDELTRGPAVQVVNSTKSEPIVLSTLRPLAEIIAAFDIFKSDALQQKKPDGTALYERNDFQYTAQGKNPTIHVFTFPDAKSADAFIAKLAASGMAYVGPSQLRPIGNSSNQSFKDQLRDLFAADSKTSEASETNSPKSPKI